MAKFLKLRIINKASECEEKMLVCMDDITQLIECKEMSKTDIAKYEKMSGRPPETATIKAGTMICTKNQDVFKSVEPMSEILVKMEKLGAVFA